MYFVNFRNILVEFYKHKFYDVMCHFWINLIGFKFFYFENILVLFCKFQKYSRGIL